MQLIIVIVFYLSYLLFKKFKTNLYFETPCVYRVSTQIMWTSATLKLDGLLLAQPANSIRACSVNTCACLVTNPYYSFIVKVVFFGHFQTRKVKMGMCLRQQKWTTAHIQCGSAVTWFFSSCPQRDDTFLSIIKLIMTDNRSSLLQRLSASCLLNRIKTNQWLEAAGLRCRCCTHWEKGSGFCTGAGLGRGFGATQF